MRGVDRGIQHYGEPESEAQGGASHSREQTGARPSAGTSVLDGLRPRVAESRRDTSTGPEGRTASSGKEAWPGKNRQPVERGTNPPEVMLKRTIEKIDAYVAKLDQRVAPLQVKLQVDTAEFPELENVDVYCVDCSSLPGGVHKAYLEKASLLSAQQLLRLQLEHPDGPFAPQVIRSIVTSGNQGYLEQMFVNNLNSTLAPEDEFLQPVRLAVLPQPDRETEEAVEQALKELGAWYRIYDPDRHSYPHPENPDWIDVAAFTDNLDGKVDGHYEGNPYHALAEQIADDSDGAVPDVVVVPYGTGALLHGLMEGTEHNLRQAGRKIAFFGGASKDPRGNKIYGDHTPQDIKTNRLKSTLLSVSPLSCVLEMDGVSGDRMSALFAKNKIPHEYSSAVGCSAAITAASMVKMHPGYDGRRIVITVVNTGMGPAERIRAASTQTASE